MERADEQGEYEAPGMRLIGTVSEIVQAGAQVGRLDGTYPRGTPSAPGLFS